MAAADEYAYLYATKLPHAPAAEAAETLHVESCNIIGYINEADFNRSRRARRFIDTQPMGDGNPHELHELLAHYGTQLNWQQDNKPMIVYAFLPDLYLIHESAYLYGSMLPMRSLQATTNTIRDDARQFLLGYDKRTTYVMVWTVNENSTNLTFVPGALDVINDIIASPSSSIACKSIKAALSDTAEHNPVRYEAYTDMVAETLDLDVTVPLVVQHMGRDDVKGFWMRDLSQFAVQSVGVPINGYVFATIPGDIMKFKLSDL